MATHANIGNAYREPDDGALFVRFIGACLNAAGAIITEDPGTANHAARLSWARGILSTDQQSVYSRVRAAKNYALAVNADVRYDPANVTDASIDGAVQDWLATLPLES